MSMIRRRLADNFGLSKYHNSDVVKLTFIVSLIAFFLIFAGVRQSKAYDCEDCGENALVCSDCHAPLHGECPNCMTANCHTNKLENINHLSGPATPLDGDLSSDDGIAAACKICHVGQNILHPFIINTDPGIIIVGTRDIDDACGQCHGGGTSSADNPPLPGIPYRTKASLAAVAEGMHASAGVTYQVTFSASVTPNTLDVYVDAVVDCGGACPPLTYDWDWDNDGPVNNGSGDPAVHTYAAAGTKTIKLTVSVAAGTVGFATRNVTLAAVDLPPAAAADCTWSGDIWTMDVIDSSTDDGPDDNALSDTSPSLTITVDWGDGSTKAYGTAGGAFSHVYSKTGTFGVSLKAVDSKLQSSTTYCTVDATPMYFEITGTVKKSVGQGSGNLTYATVQLLSSSGVFIKSVSTGTTGTFSFGSLKPGTYKIKANKSGYTFPDPATIVVGPSSIGNTIQALTP